MNFSISKSRESVWVWLLWGLSIYFVLEVGPFFIVKLLFNKNVGELAGPYLAFAIPAVVVMPLIWWLRKWEEQGGTPPRQLARGWGLSMVLFFVFLEGALYYSGVELGLMGTTNLVLNFIVSVLFIGVIGYFAAYVKALKGISARAAGKRDDLSPNERPK